MAERPSYIDLQVNGYAGVDFNSDRLTAEGLHTACRKIEYDQVAGFLATIITDDIAAMVRRLRRLVALRRQDELARRLIVGLHVEGPFFNENEGYRGAHPARAIHPADLDEAKQLVDAGAGLIKIVTLSPERDAGAKVTRWLSQQGIVVSAGHCDAGLDQLDAAIDAGLFMFTHLGNGCPIEQHRHDNIVQRVLSRSERLWLCFIADGIHVPMFALGNYLRCATIQRCIVVSDAMAAAGLGPGRYTLGDWDLEVDESLAVWAPGRKHLVGSALGLNQAAARLAAELELSAAQIDRLTRANPLAVIQ